MHAGMHNHIIMHCNTNEYKFSTCPNFGLLAAVSCTNTHNVMGYKYRLAQVVQETAANEHNLRQLLNKILMCSSRWHL